MPLAATCTQCPKVYLSPDGKCTARRLRSSRGSWPGGDVYVYAHGSIQDPNLGPFRSGPWSPHPTPKSAEMLWKCYKAATWGKSSHWLPSKPSDWLGALHKQSGQPQYWTFCPRLAANKPRHTGFHSNLPYFQSSPYNKDIAK